MENGDALAYDWSTGLLLHVRVRSFDVSKPVHKGRTCHCAKILPPRWKMPCYLGIHSAVAQLIEPMPQCPL